MGQKVAASLVLLLMIVQIIVVALRYSFSLGSTWSIDLLTYLFMLAVVLPGLAVVVQNTGVRVDIFYASYSPNRQHKVDRVGLLFLLLPATAYAAYASLGPTMSSWRILETSPTFGGLPGYFLLKTAVTLLFGLLAVAAFALACRAEPYTIEPKS